MGITFLGFRVFYYHKLLRKSNIRNFERKFNQAKILFREGIITREKAVEFLEGWIAYANCANTYKYRRHIVKLFNKSFPIQDSKNYSKRDFNFIRRIKESEIKFSVQKTLFLYSKGLSVEEISRKRGVKESTVWEHLANLIEHNQISLWRVLPRKTIFKIYSKIKSKNDLLRDIKKRIKDKSVQFNEISCVLAHIKST